MTETLPHDTLKALRCKKCNNYLSVPPVTISSEDYFCGRCKTPGMRNTAYEALAKRARFPCKNDEAGCTESFFFQEVQEHEITCQYNPMKCPFCERESPKTTLKDHFKDEHEDLILHGGFSLPKNEPDVDFKRLIVDDQDFYVLQMCGFLENDKFFLALTTIFDPKDVVYNVVVKTEDHKLVLGGQKLIPFHLFHHYTHHYRFSDHHIKSVLNSSEYTFEIEILRKSEQEGLLEELECIICHEYMKPPIFLCRTGHSLCGLCKPKIFECPSCKCPFVEGARNFTLEKVAGLVTYPCRNRPECKYKGRLREITAHEANCRTKIVDCPLNVGNFDCAWSGPCHDVSKHVRRRHPQQLLAVPTKKICRQISNLYVPTVFQVLGFDNNTFRLSTSHDLYFVVWKVEHVELDAKESPKYRFVVEVSDQGEGEGNILDYPCVQLEDSLDFDHEDNCLKVDQEQLMPFVDEFGYLSYKIKIKHA